MKFSDFVCFKAIVPKLKATDRDGAIAELVGSLDKSGCLENGDCRRITDAIIKRENEASTGMGKGVAIPHVKNSEFNEVLKKMASAESEKISTFVLEKLVL